MQKYFNVVKNGPLRQLACLCLCPVSLTQKTLAGKIAADKKKKKNVKDSMTFHIMEQSLNPLGYLALSAFTLATTLTLSNNECSYIQHLKLTSLQLGNMPTLTI